MNLKCEKEAYKIPIIWHLKCPKKYLSFLKWTPGIPNRNEIFLLFWVGTLIGWPDAVSSAGSSYF